MSIRPRCPHVFAVLAHVSAALRASGRRIPMNCYQAAVQWLREPVRSLEVAGTCSLIDAPMLTFGRYPRNFRQRASIPVCTIRSRVNGAITSMEWLRLQEARKRGQAQETDCAAFQSVCENRLRFHLRAKSGLNGLLMSAIIAIVKGSGRGAVWLARLLGVQEVGSSSLPAPTSNIARDPRN